MTEELTAEHTLAHLWERAVEQWPDRPFLTFRDNEAGLPDRSWTYREFDDLVARTAGRLRELGVAHGDSVHLCLRNCPAFVMVWLATTRLGAWMVPVDPGSQAPDIQNQLQRTTPRVGICSTVRADVYREGAAGLLDSIIEVSESVTDTETGSALLGDPTDGVPVSPSDRIAIMFTSGTTSEPKGVVLTQANYWYTAKVMADLAALESESRWYVCLPLFHGNAQYYCFLPSIATGASVGLAAKFSASKWASHVDELGATHASLFAAPVRMILARREESIPTLKLQHVWFAQSLAEKHFLEFAEICGTRPRQLYGMTETTAIVTANLGPDPAPDTIGTVVPGRVVELLDPVTGQPVPDGSPGVLTVLGERGRDLFLEYLDNDSANAKAFPRAEGSTSWFSTGDLVRQDPSGDYRFVGRIDDVVKVSGENVSLTEVEARIAQAPGVLEAAVVAVDDPVRDVVPVAYVVAREPTDPPTVEELAAWGEANLTPAARPRKWTLIDELPRTSVGKIRRFKLT